MKKIILDTNAYSHYLRGDESVLEVLSMAELVFMSVIVLGELYAGFKQGGREKQNREWLAKFLSKATVQAVNVTNETAEIFSGIIHGLRKKGRPLPLNDVWLAAHAFETGSALVTFDAHFQNIPGLRLAL